MRRHGWWVGTVVGVVAGTGLAVGVQGWQEDREASDVELSRSADAADSGVPEPVEAIRDLLDQDSLVVVDPLLEDRVPAEDRQRAEEILATSPVPAHLAFLSYPRDEAGYTPTGAGPQWWTHVGEDGHYVILWDNGNTDTGAIGMEPEYVSERTQGQPGPALVRIAGEMTTWEAVPVDDADDPGESDYWGGTWGGIGAAALFGTFVVVPLFLLLRWVVGLRRRKVS